jgi:hypothetical protein
MQRSRPGVEEEMAPTAVTWALEAWHKAHWRPLAGRSGVEPSASSSSARCGKAGGRAGPGESDGMHCDMLAFKTKETGRWYQVHMVTSWLNSATVRAQYHCTMRGPSASARSG